MENNQDLLVSFAAAGFIVGAIIAIICVYLVRPRWIIYDSDDYLNAIKRESTLTFVLSQEEVVKVKNWVEKQDPVGSVIEGRYRFSFTPSKSYMQVVVSNNRNGEELTFKKV